MRSICPTSSAFDGKAGTAQEQITRMLHSATVVGSPFVRCFLGTFNDRRTDGGIDRHIENTVEVLRSVRSRVVDSGLKIAIENHAGDMQGRELKSLIEAAGKDFVGACLDSGNPLWAIEDPHLTLETLAPYVLTSHIRDTAVWRVPEGAAVAWVRMGEGNVGIAEYIEKYGGCARDGRCRWRSSSQDHASIRISPTRSSGTRTGPRRLGSSADFSPSPSEASRNRPILQCRKVRKRRGSGKTWKRASGGPKRDWPHERCPRREGRGSNGREQGYRRGDRTAVR